MATRKAPRTTTASSPKHSKRTSSRSIGPQAFTLEIGTEELPAAFIPGALADLEQLGHALLKEHRLGYGNLRTVGTPRRLVLLVEAVELKQSPLVQEFLGPPKSAAFDPSGNPTKAAEGFAKSHDVPVNSLTIKETPKGLYLCVTKHQTGQGAHKVLAGALPQALAKLNFPKAMRWNASRVRFARPVRWLLAMLGKKAIRFEFAGVRSGETTMGHRFYRSPTGKAGTAVVISDASSYVERIKKAGVIVDPRERRALIETQVSKLAKIAGGTVDPDTRAELIEQAVYGVELPHAILGSFEREFLSVPKPVLISSMKEHQGFFSLIDQGGRLLPKFVAVTNMPGGDRKLITKGNERVLTARLKDAQHFFREDLKRSLPERVSDLHQVVFHQKLGSVHQKMERVRALVGWLAEAVNRPDLRAICERAAFLAKADLTTGMVGEFPTLQGVMGEAYAREAGEAPEVCQAIGSHYYPRFPDDQLPSGLPGILLALADRCDSIVAFFSVGMLPSGSEDPLGLRRAAYGLVRLLTETPLGLNVVEIFAKNMELLETQGVVKASDQTVSNVLGFILERLRFYAKQSAGLREDVMDAVIRVRSAQACDVTDLFRRMQSLHAMMNQPDFEPLTVGFKRAHRIVEKEQWNDISIRQELLTHESELRVFQALGAVKEEVREAVAGQRYTHALHALLKLKTPIDQFFNSVMVNDENREIRANRLSVLTAIDRVFLQVADFSAIQSVA